jgi:hypothetical protein
MRRPRPGGRTQRYLRRPGRVPPSAPRYCVELVAAQVELYDHGGATLAATYRKLMSGKLPHSTVNVGERQFLAAKLMLDEERVLAHPPQRDTPRELAQEGLLVAREAEQFPGALGLSRGLAENDSGLGVRE